MNTDTDPSLLDAVDALTLPKRAVNWQPEHEHTWVTCKGRHGMHRCTKPDCDSLVCEWCDQTSRNPEAYNAAAQAIKQRTDLPLLEQLRNAVTSDIGGNGGGKPGRERTPIDVGALNLSSNIHKQIRSWMIETGGKPGDSLTSEQLLRAWYVLYNATVHDEFAINVRRRTLEGWEQSILDTLDPPKQIEITAACPVCGNRWVNIADRGITVPDPDDIERVAALNAVERDSLEDCYALCRACETVWKGVGRMRQLRIAIDDAETRERA